MKDIDIIYGDFLDTMTHLESLNEILQDLESSFETDYDVAKTPGALSRFTCFAFYILSVLKEFQANIEDLDNWILAKSRIDRNMDASPKEAGHAV